MIHWKTRRAEILPAIREKLVCCDQNKEFHENSNKHYSSIKMKRTRFSKKSVYTFNTKLNQYQNHNRS